MFAFYRSPKRISWSWVELKFETIIIETIIRLNLPFKTFFHIAVKKHNNIDLSFIFKLLSSVFEENRFVIHIFLFMGSPSTFIYLFFYLLIFYSKNSCWWIIPYPLISFSFLCWSIGNIYKSSSFSGVPLNNIFFWNVINVIS